MVNEENREEELMCPECGKPLSEHNKKFESKKEFIEGVSNSYVDSVFEDFWSQRKNDLKQLSKKEVAEEAFFESIANFLHNFIPDKQTSEEKSPKEIIDT
jgi:hypothetical protein